MKIVDVLNAYPLTFNHDCPHIIADLVWVRKGHVMLCVSCGTRFVPNDGTSSTVWVVDKELRDTDPPKVMGDINYHYRKVIVMYCSNCGCPFKGQPQMHRFCSHKCRMAFAGKKSRFKKYLKDYYNSRLNWIARGRIPK